MLYGGLFWGLLLTRISNPFRLEDRETVLTYCRDTAAMVRSLGYMSFVVGLPSFLRPDGSGRRSNDFVLARGNASCPDHTNAALRFA
ncbi:hypothetical protein EDC04DRAFT_2672313 [Pisolithus marmoratus]|nr:hypothetical protein EDC04DRAFT_2672313 [Pisolithus marmoratus]